MIPILNSIGFALVLLLITKTFAVSILRFFKYNSLADRYCLVKDTDDEGLKILRLFVKFGLFFPLVADISTIIQGKESIIFSESLNASTIVVGILALCLGIMVLFGALMSWHESIEEK